ncbi:MAG: PAS domain S-box protein [Syntrophorhabdaceae bacterium]|nr:PAS domain S-box protein [Syntrophorhabdaceae bacterium]
MGHGCATCGGWVKGGLINLELDSFKILADSVADFVWVKDRGGRFVLVNKAMHERIFCEKDVSDVIGKTDAEIALPFRDAGYQHDFDLKCMESDLIVYETKTPRKFEQHGYFKDIFLRLEVYKTPIFDTGNEVIGTVGYARDITGCRKTQGETHDQKQRFAILAEQAPFGLVMIDRDGNYRYANRKFIEMFGYDLADIPDGKTWFRRACPDTAYRKKVVARWKDDCDELKPGEKKPWIFTVKCKDRSEKIANFIPVQLETGEIAIACEDITSYVTARRALEDSQRKLADIVNYLPDATMVIDSSGRIIAWNKSMEKLTGMRAENILGAGDYEYAIPFYGRRRPILVDLALNPEDKAIEGQYPYVTREEDTLLTELFVPTFGREGAYLWATAKALYDMSGNIVGAIETIRNVTEIKLGQEAIRQSAEKYRTLFDESLDVIFIAAPEGKLLDINTAGVKLFGYESKKELLEVDIGNDLYFNEADRRFYRETIEREGCVNSFELTLKKKDGRKVTVSLNATAVFDGQGKVVAYRGTMRDITNVKLLEQQLLESQKMETLGRLAGGIAHDFNNILNIILGGAQLIKMKASFDEKINGYLTSIEKAVFRASDFVKQLLAFSRRQILNFEVVSLNDIVADFTKMINRIIGENIEMEIIPAADMPKIKVDIAQANQILLNLVVNARDAMARGGTLTISTSSEIVDKEFCFSHVGAKPGRYAALTISDTGEGIDPETVKKIFEPFFTTKRTGEGTGLGLSVVYGIVKQHGGFITVESKIGEGTKFKVYFAAVDDKKRKEASRIEPVLGGSERILIVEDDATLREISSEMLSMLGYGVILASDGEEAIRIFREQMGAIDLVIIDVVMPRLSGKETYALIRDLKPSIQALFITGYQIDEAHTGFIIEKGLDAVQKPFSIETLGRKVREALNKKA